MSGRIVLLGGASEVGLAIVEALVAREPREVMLAGRSGSPHRDAALATANAIGAPQVSWLDFDATDPQAHPALIDEVFSRPVDVVVVAFGVLGDPEHAWQDQQAAVRVAQTNYVGAVSVGVLVGQAMRRQGSGTIIAVSSVAGERVRRSNFVYGSSKAGMDGFYLQLGVALREAGVRVLVVRPGAVRTRMIEGRKIALSTTAQAVAAATLRALDRGRRRVRVPALFNLIVPVYQHLPAWVAERLKF